LSRGRELADRRLISSFTYGVPALSWRVLLLTYQGASKTILNILDWILCIIFVLDGFNNVRGISWLALDLLASQQGSCSAELFRLSEASCDR